METYQKGWITIDYYGECFEMFDECITYFGEPFRKKNQAYPQVFHDIYHSVETISTTDLTDLTDRVLQGVRQKPEKPLGEDGGRCPCCRRTPSSPRR